MIAYKITVVLLICHYIWRIIDQDSNIREILKEYEGQSLIDISTEIVKNVNHKHFPTILKYTIGEIVKSSIEFVVAVIAFDLISPNIALAYMVFWVTMLTYHKINGRKDKIISEKQYKYSIKQMFIHFIDLSFFIYLFINVFN